MPAGWMKWACSRAGVSGQCHMVAHLRGGYIQTAGKEEAPSIQ